jgi:hypothetical protein
VRDRGDLTPNSLDHPSSQASHTPFFRSTTSLDHSSPIGTNQSPQRPRSAFPSFAAWTIHSPCVPIHFGPGLVRPGYNRRRAARPSPSSGLMET